MALGAFVAGLLLAETEYRREIEVTIEPFRGLLLGLYFVSVGAGINPALIVARPGLILGLAAALAAAKGVTLFALARAFRVPSRVSAEMSLLLGPGGEFGNEIYAISRGAGGNATKGAIIRPGVIYRVDPATGKSSVFFDLNTVIPHREHRSSP